MLSLLALALISANVKPSISLAVRNTAPLASPPSTQSDSVLPSCNPSDDLRSLWDIIWSCLATIAACTWIAVHPNIPGPNESWWMAIRTRLKIMLYAVIAPEMVIFWSMRQWCGANAIYKRYQEKGWTRTHGFFLLMGGFLLHSPDDNKPLYVLSFEDFSHLESQGFIEFPTITEKEIEDKSKSDFLAKGFALLQTTWFIIQMCARTAQHLPVTEFELATLGFAILSCIMYFFWWNKPMDVACAVPVRLKETSIRRVASESTTMDGLVPAQPLPPFPFPSPHPAYHSFPAISGSKWGDSDYSVPLSAVSSTQGSTASDPFLHAGSDSDTFSDYTHHLHHYHHTSSTTSFLPEVSKTHSVIPDSDSQSWACSYFARPIIFVLRPFDNMAACTSIPNGPSSPHPSMHVPTFYSPSVSTSSHQVLIIMSAIIAIFFGGIHCLDWSFPSNLILERLLWRISCVLVVLVPIFLLLVMVSETSAVEANQDVLYVVSITGILLYIPARLVLLVVAFISLRSLPVEALKEVEWTAFLLHF